MRRAASLARRLPAQFFLVSLKTALLGTPRCNRAPLPRCRRFLSVESVNLFEDRAGVIHFSRVKDELNGTLATIVAREGENYRG